MKGLTLGMAVAAIRQGQSGNMVPLSVLNGVAQGAQQRKATRDAEQEAQYNDDWRRYQEQVTRNSEQVSRNDARQTRADNLANENYRRASIEINQIGSLLDQHLLSPSQYNERLQSIGQAYKIDTSRQMLPNGAGQAPVGGQTGSAPPTANTQSIMLTDSERATLNNNPMLKQYIVSQIARFDKINYELAAITNAVTSSPNKQRSTANLAAFWLTLEKQRVLADINQHLNRATAGPSQQPVSLGTPAFPRTPDGAPVPLAPNRPLRQVATNTSSGSPLGIPQRTRGGNNYRMIG